MIIQAKTMIKCGKIRRFIAFGVSLFLAGVSPLRAQTPATPPGVIFDTDMCTDLDDMLALAMLHALQDRNEIKILAVTVTSSNCFAVPAIDAIDHFYDHPGIPIGMAKDAINLETQLSWLPGQVSYPNGLDTQRISNERRPDGGFLYPHDITDDGQAQDAVTLIRRTLVGQPDHSVVLVQVGFSNTFAALLDSPPDAASPLNGRDLIAKKVKLLSTMAGNFSQPVGLIGTPEFNLTGNISAARHVFADWPTPLVTSGFEIGIKILFPASRIADGFNYSTHDPIAEFYRNWSTSFTAKDGKTYTTTWPHDHATFDLTAVLYAVRPDDGYFTLSPPGKITVTTEGATQFVPRADGQQRYLIIDDAQKAKTLEAMVMLVTQPPLTPAP